MDKDTIIERLQHNRPNLTVSSLYTYSSTLSALYKKVLNSILLLLLYTITIIIYYYYYYILLLLLYIINYVVLRSIIMGYTVCKNLLLSLLSWWNTITQETSCAYQNIYKDYCSRKYVSRISNYSYMLYAAYLSAYTFSLSFFLK